MIKGTLKEHILKICFEKSIEEKEKLVRTWEKEINMDDLDYESMRLAPFLLYQLKNSNIKSIHEKRLKVLYKFWWLKTNHLTDQLKIVCNRLKNNGIDPLVLKGGNIMYYYPDPVLRPMADIDIMIPFNQIKDALQVLKGIGYSWKKEEEFFINKLPSSTFEFYHAIGVKHTNLDVQIDLHWRTGSLLTYQFTEDLIQNQEQHQIFKSAYKPQLAYEIFHNIVHAVISKSRDNLNWIIDMFFLNQVANEETWLEVVQLAQNEQKYDLLITGISYLKEFGIDVKGNFPDLEKTIKVNVLMQNKEINKIKNPIKIFYHRFNNSLLIINNFFPNASIFLKTIQFVRFGWIQILRYLYLYRRII